MQNFANGCFYAPIFYDKWPINGYPFSHFSPTPLSPVGGGGREMGWAMDWDLTKRIDGVVHAPALQTQGRAKVCERWLTRRVVKNFNAKFCRSGLLK